MAGCFGNSAEDRYRERELDSYLDSTDIAADRANDIAELAEEIEADDRLLADLLCTNNNNSQFIYNIFHAFNEYRSSPVSHSQYHDFGIDIVGIMREYIELVAKKHAEHIYDKDN